MRTRHPLRFVVSLAVGCGSVLTVSQLFCLGIAGWPPVFKLHAFVVVV